MNDLIQIRQRWEVLNKELQNTLVSSTQKKFSTLKTHCQDFYMLYTQFVLINNLQVPAQYWQAGAITNLTTMCSFNQTF